LARGHLLIEDLPGMGKTTLAHALARCLGLQYQRIQFTSDLLPADILGAAVYERQRETFVFHPGPIFAQLILADEINRATPKTQSALLEAMEEGQVTIEGETRPLPEPFFVIATQNPAYQIGTFPLAGIAAGPLSDADRTGLSRRPGRTALLEGEDRREMLARLPVAMTPEQLHEAQAASQRCPRRPAAAGLRAGAAGFFPPVQPLPGRIVAARRLGSAAGGAGLGGAAPARSCPAGRRAGGVAGGGQPSPASWRRQPGAVGDRSGRAPARGLPYRLRAYTKIDPTWKNATVCRSPLPQPLSQRARGIFV
jgi:hypothetical protein